MAVTASKYLILVFLMLLISYFLVSVTSRRQVYVYSEEITSHDSRAFQIDAKLDKTIHDPVDVIKDTQTLIDDLSVDVSDNSEPFHVNMKSDLDSVDEISHFDDTQTFDDENKTINEPVNMKSDFDSVDKISHFDDTQTLALVNTKSDLDSADKMTHFDDPQVITTITPQSQVLFPYPNITHQPHEILNSPWAIKMKAKLEAAKIRKQLTYVTVSMDYFSVLINWLIYANLNAKSVLDNLLVVCLDKSSHEILSQKGVLSQVVEVNDIIYSMKDMDKSIVFSARVITRLTVLRLLNYWGYDVLVMDIDALLINNIQPIFDHFHDSDIIVSTANMKKCLPTAARMAWHFCLCIGVFLIRDNTNTERMWQELGSTHVDVAGSDQNRLNNILVKSNIKWTPVDYDANHYLQGESQNKDITVIALPQEVVCRNQCNVLRLSSYYVYHPVTTHHAHLKHNVMMAQKIWKIKDNWSMTLKTTQSTTNWLNEVTA